MSLKLLSINGFMQSKLVVAHTFKLSKDRESDYVIHIDKKLAPLVEKGLRTNNTKGIYIQYLEGGVQHLECFELVKYSWCCKGIELTFRLTEIPKQRVSIVSKVLAFIGF